MNIIVTPDTIRRIEDELKYIIVSHWARREQDLWWRRLVKTRSQATKRELVQWMLETSGIRPIGNGGSFDYDDLMEKTHEVVVEKFGAALRLSDDEIEDGSAFDRAGKWATQVSGSAAFWPQEQAAQLLRDGKVKGSYDGVAFFHAAHPINPVLGAGAGTFPNLHTAMPFSPKNLAEGFRRVATIKGTDGKYRKLKPRLVAAGEVERLAVVQALGAEVYADPVRSGTTVTAPATNVIKTSYGFEQPIISADFDETADVYFDDATGERSAVQAAGAGKTLKTRGVWFLACELVEDDELGGLVFSERKAFNMNSYSPLDDVTLAQMDSWEWQFKGRNANTFGHPFLLHRFEP